MDASEYYESRVQPPIWYRCPDWIQKCALCLQTIDRGEIIADCGPLEVCHERCFEAFYEGGRK